MDSIREEKIVLMGTEVEVKEGSFRSKLKAFGSFGRKDMCFRADKIDLKSLDIQLAKRLHNAWCKDKVDTPRNEWEIDLSKLELRHELARGTYGIVYKGIYDGRDVAVKLMDWGDDGFAREDETLALRESFQKEVSVWHKLDHANVTKFIGASMGTNELKIPEKNPTSNGNKSLPARSCCVVVEYVPGGTLKQFNRKCDVYSFSICLWEIYCCDMPYWNLSFSEISYAVVRQNVRPKIPKCCPSALANIMRRCWDPCPDKRPEMDEIVGLLEAINTSKGGGMIPDGQVAKCFCFKSSNIGP